MAPSLYIEITYPKKQKHAAFTMHWESEGFSIIITIPTKSPFDVLYSEYLSLRYIYLSG